jgi:hypothetical protein
MGFQDELSLADGVKLLEGKKGVLKVVERPKAKNEVILPNKVRVQVMNIKFYPHHLGI